MKLWTIQSPEAWEVLCRTGVLTCPNDKVTDGFEDAYKWFIEQMELRLKTSRPEGCSMLWAWQLYNGKTDLTVDDVKYYSRPVGERGYLIGIEVPDEHVLLSDFMSWHSVLNGFYLSNTEAEDEEFDRRLEAAGFRNAGISSAPPPFDGEIRESWNRIFELQSSPGWRHGPEGVQDVQATFFQLRMDQVYCADEFVGLKDPEEFEETEDND